MGIRWLIQKGAVLLLLTLFVSGTANAQSLKVQLLNGRTGKPITKGRRIWVYFSNSAGRQILDLHTDSQGVIQFETSGAKTFQVSPVGYIPCGEQPVGAPARDYPIDQILAGWALNEADRKLAASTSPSDPNRHRALAAHQSANRNTVENNMRPNYYRTTGETKTLGKEKQKTP